MESPDQPIDKSSSRETRATEETRLHLSPIAGPSQSHGPWRSQQTEVSKSRFSASYLGLGADMFLPTAGPSQPLSHSFGPQFSLESGEFSLERGLSRHGDLSPLSEGLQRVGPEERVRPVDLSLSGQHWKHMDHNMLKNVLNSEKHKVSKLLLVIFFSLFTSTANISPQAPFVKPSVVLML